MTVTATDTGDLDYAELATLKRLALAGGLDGTVAVSCSTLADRLDVSPQTASRRLRSLEASDLLARRVDGDGQRVRVTDAGRRVLSREHLDYRRIFETDPGTELAGVVETGMGEGAHYLSLSGYASQFEARLGYVPYPGTLNVRLDAESARRYAGVPETGGVAIDAWSDEEGTYGAAVCYPVEVTADADACGRVHLLVPERTHHDDDLVELIAPVCLRERLDLTDGSEVIVRVPE